MLSGASAEPYKETHSSRLGSALSPRSLKFTSKPMPKLLCASRPGKPTSTNELQGTNITKHISGELWEGQREKRETQQRMNINRKRNNRHKMDLWNLIEAQSGDTFCQIFIEGWFAQSQPEATLTASTETLLASCILLKATHPYHSKSIHRAVSINNAENYSR